MTPQTDLLTEEARDLIDHGARIADAEPFDLAGSENDEFTEPESHAVDYLREHGFSVHRTGPGRITFNVPETYAPHIGVMVKVARYREDELAGTTQNRVESEIWSDADESLRDILAPVITLGDNSEWVAMPFAEPVSTGEESVRESLADHGWETSEVDVDHMGAVSDSDDPVLIDYGHGVAPSAE